MVVQVILYSLTAHQLTVLFQHRVPHTVLWVHWGQQLLGCDPPAPSAVGLSGAQCDRLVPGNHHCCYPRSVQGYGEHKSKKVTPPPKKWKRKSRVHLYIRSKSEWRVTGNSKKEDLKAVWVLREIKSFRTKAFLLYLWLQTRYFSLLPTGHKQYPTLSNIKSRTSVS